MMRYFKVKSSMIISKLFYIGFHQKLKCPEEFPLSVGTSICSSRLESLEWVVDHNNDDVKGIHIHNSDRGRNKIGSSPGFYPKNMDNLSK